jgi:hypothetical protein
MDVDNARTGDVRLEESGDPRTRLAQEKFFTQRPKPLERWLWRQRVPPAAERVFWFHWTEGARNGDWYSQFALHFIARQCEVDSSTVTRAYQILKRLGLIRRTDPGRNAANPFEQATFITEVLVPPGLLAELPAYPNRPRPRPRIAPPPATVSSPPTDASKPPHPHEHLDLKQRRERLTALAAALSTAERDRWHKAICGTAQRMDFDPGTQVPADIQAEIQHYLASRQPPTAPPTLKTPVSQPTSPRRVSVFDLARLRHGLQKLSGIQGADELARQILWAIEVGSLRQFGVAHAINIALKKLRGGQWTRPHRMPPNWARKINVAAQPETCSGA